MAFIKVLLRIVIVSGLLAYFIAAAVMLTTRYWVLPRVDEWRPEIEKAISDAAGVPVQFDSIDAEWFGLNATLNIKNLRILDKENVAQLGIPSVQAIVSWRSLLRMEPIFRYLGVDELILVARRAPDGQLTIGGFEVAQDRTDKPGTGLWHSATMRWLLRQGKVNVTNARVIWVDQARDTTPLVFQDIDLTATNGLLAHELDLRVNLPEELGGELELVARVDALQGSLSNFLIDEPDGTVYAEVSRFDPKRLSPWLDVPDVQGRYALRLWANLLSGKFTTLSLNLMGEDVRLAGSHPQDDLLLAGKLQWRAEGPLAMWREHIDWGNWVAAPKSPMQIQSSVSALDVYVQAPVDGMQPISADQMTADLAISRRTDGMVVQVNEAALANADGLVTARGSWTQDNQGKGGLLDLQGTLARFNLTSLHKYLPAAIGQEAHDWLRQAFKAGFVSRASFEVKGAVDDFPYSAQRGSGIFRVDGTFQGWDLDYIPDLAVGELPWPILKDLKGSISLVNDRISADVNAGALVLPKGQRITIAGLNADLVDLETKPILSLQGTTRAGAASYLALFADTALKDLAPAFVRDFAGKGSWSMPLKLTVPLDQTEDTSFLAELSLNGGSVTYATSPEITDVTGAAVISEKGFVSRNLAGQMLGGPVKITGGMNHLVDTVVAQGELEWADVADFARSEIVSSWLKGKLPYEVRATVSEDDTFAVTMSSDMKGTSIALPAPFGKGVNQTQVTDVSWRGKVTPGAADQWDVSIGNLVSVRALSQAKPSARLPYFSSMSIALGNARPINGGGLTVAARLSELSLDDWMPVYETVERELKNGGSDQASVFPAIRRARLESPVFRIDDFHLDKMLAELTVTNGHQYDLSLKAEQTQGNVSWAVSQGQLADGFVIKFDRLDLGRKEGSTATEKVHDKVSAPLPEPGTLSSLPRVNLTINDFTLHGTRLGRVNLVGQNSPDRRQWNIERLDIVNPHAEFVASGACRYHDDPGVFLDAKLKTSNLGDLIEYLGKGQAVRNGEGTLDAKIDWKGLPWRFDYSGLSGSATVELKGGVFDHINSRSARVLELLSLQSISRLFSINANPDDTFAQGFPWNSINGNFDIRRGVVDTRDLQVDSPVATITLTGGSSLVDETWNMDALVRPNLDLSGTALATGFLVNPLVGLGALIGQYVLKHPVEAAMSQRFTVTGTWQDPIIGSGSGGDRSKEPQSQSGSESRSNAASGSSGSVQVNNSQISQGPLTNSPAGADLSDRRIPLGD